MSRLDRTCPKSQHIGAITDSPAELARLIAQRVQWRTRREGHHACLAYTDAGGLVYVSAADSLAVRDVPAEAIIGSYTVTAGHGAIREDVVAMQEAAA